MPETRPQKTSWAFVWGYGFIALTGVVGLTFYPSANEPLLVIMPQSMGQNEALNRIFSADVRLIEQLGSNRFIVKAPNNHIADPIKSLRAAGASWILNGDMGFGCAGSAGRYKNQLGLSKLKTD